MTIRVWTNYFSISQLVVEKIHGRRNNYFNYNFQVKRNCFPTVNCISLKCSYLDFFLQFVFFVFKCWCQHEFEFPRNDQVLESALNNIKKFGFLIFNIRGTLLYVFSALLFFSCLWQLAVCWISHPAVVLIRWGKACWELW